MLSLPLLSLLLQGCPPTSSTNPVIGQAAQSCMSGTPSFQPTNGAPYIPGGGVIYWPDAKQNESDTLAKLINGLSGDATLYIRAGTYDIPLPAKWDDSQQRLVLDKNNYGTIHIRGEGHDKVILRGAIWLYRGSSIEDVTIDNRTDLFTEDRATVFAMVGGLTLNRVVINGGSQGIDTTSGALAGGGNGDPNHFDCVSVSHSKYNGAMLGEGQSGLRSSFSVIKNLSISETGNAGLYIDGDSVSMDNVSVQHAHTVGIVGKGNSHQTINLLVDDTTAAGMSYEGNGHWIVDSTVRNSGTGGIYIEGDRNTIQGVLVEKTNSAGIITEGSGFTLRDSIIQKLELTNGTFKGTGLILNGNSSGFTVTDNEFYQVWNGIYRGGNTGTLSGNMFDEIENQNVID